MQQSTQAAEFDQYAKDYRTLHNNNLKVTGFDTFHFIDVKVNCLLRHEKNEPLQVLDLGCGDGYTAEYMYQKFPLWKIEGIEVSEESIAVARQRNAPNAKFQWFDGTSIPFADNSFDVIFIACIFHHVPLKEHDALMKEANRVLKPGGRLYLFEHNPYNPGTQYLVRTCVFDGTAHLLAASHFTNIFKKQNWQITFCKYIVFFPGWKWISPIHSFEKYLSWLPLGGQYYFRVTKK
jgi:ubiquinone/menaquinone biosynthesis C-methylase UbiE